jgi:hypothetical protein
MLRHNPKIVELIYEDTIQTLAKLKGITIQESRQEIANMSFIEYIRLLEAGANIVPPSGQSIGPSAGNTSSPVTTGSPTATTQGPQAAPSKAQVMWNGPGAPIEQGMTVGLKGPNGIPVPGEITQVDHGAKGVRVKNPTTGQEEWHGNDDLQQYTGGATVPGATNQASGLQQQQMAEDIKRMRQLAGIAEDASGGCTGAGSVGGGIPVELGSPKRRQPVEEGPSEEYTPGVAKTVAGDTKPNQASGRLSANLAARGKKTASRTNNGFKK